MQRKRETSTSWNGRSSKIDVDDDASETKLHEINIQLQFH